MGVEPRRALGRSRARRGDLVRERSLAVVAALVFGIVNLVVRPLVVLLALPAVILTLGLALLLVNALMLLLTGALVPGFDVRDFFWAAVLGALIVWIVNMLLHAVLPDSSRGWRRFVPG